MFGEVDAIEAGAIRRLKKRDSFVEQIGEGPTRIGDMIEKANFHEFPRAPPLGFHDTLLFRQISETSAKTNGRGAERSMCRVA
jgi:hypothetical protein